MTTDTALVVTEPRQRLTSGIDVFADPDTFAHAQRVAQVFSASSMVPAHLRGNLADCLIAYQIARRLNEEPLTVMQNIYIVSGRPGWKTEYVIARANRSGVFQTRITWQSTGSGDDLSVTAMATLADSGTPVQVTCDMKMAQAEGWTKNAKYRSMPEHMLRWRSAAMLIRLYAPEVMLGLPTAEEVETYPAPAPRNVTPRSTAPRTVDTVLNTIAKEPQAPLQPAQDPAPSADDGLDIPPSLDRRRTVERVLGDLGRQPDPEPVQEDPSWNARDDSIARDADGSAYDAQTGEVIEEAAEQSQEARPEVQEKPGKPDGADIFTALKVLTDAAQPANGGEYEGFILAHWQDADTEAKREAVRMYWQMSGGDRKRFRMSKNQEATIADQLRRMQAA